MDAKRISPWGRVRNLPQAAWYKFYILAGSQYGFMRLVNLLRIGTLLILTAYVGVIHNGENSVARVYGYYPWLLIAYVVFIIYNEYLLFFNPTRFDEGKLNPIYFLVDTLVIALSNAVAFELRSDLYLLYFIPLLVIARFFRLRTLVVFLTLIAIATILTWSITPEVKDYSDIVLWITVLLPRMGFLGILTIFYIIYHRRRSVTGGLHSKAYELIEKFSQLSTGVFSVDRHYRIAAANVKLVERHGQFEQGSLCRDWLCHRTSDKGATCDRCPLRLAIQSGEVVERAKIALIDRKGDSYSALVSAIPVQGERGQVAGATAFVVNHADQEEFRHELFSYSENVERTIDAQTQINLAKINRLNRQIQAFFEASYAIPGLNQKDGIDKVLFNITELFGCTTALIFQPGTDLQGGGQDLVLTNAIGISGQAREGSLFVDLSTDVLIARTFNTGEKQRVSNIQLSPEASSFPCLDRSSDHRAMICLPLKAREKDLGVLALYRREAKPFTADESEIAEALANHLAAAIFNYRLLTQISRQSDERQKGLEALIHFSQQLVPQESVQTLAELVADITCEVLHAESSSVFMIEDGILRRVSIFDQDSHWFSDESYAIGQGITGQAALAGESERYGKPVIENAVDKSPEVISAHLEEYRNHLKSGEVRHLIAVPLNGQNRTFGVLRVINKLTDDGKIDPAGFSQHDLEIMTTIACIVAVAMENSRRLEEKTFLMEVGQTITASLSSDEVLSNSLERAVRLLNAVAGFILVKDSSSGDLTFRVTFGKGVRRLWNQTLPRDEGVAYQVVRTGEPAIANNVTKDPRFNTWLYQHTGFTTDSLLSVAIQSGNQIIGVIEIANKRNGGFKRTDLDLLSALAPWTAISMENARLYEAEQKRRHLAEALQDSMQVIASNLELQSIFDNIASALAQVVNYDTTSVFLKEGKKLILKMQAGFPEDEQLPLSTARLDVKTNKPFRKMMKTRRPILIRDMQKEMILDPIIGTKHIRSWIGAPLIVENKVIGFLAVDNWEPNQYTGEDVSLVQTFAGQVAIAVQNANLYEQLAHRAEFLHALQDKIAKITTAKSQADILNKVATAARDLMNCEISGVGLYDERHQMIYGLPDAGYCGVPQEYARNFRFSINRPGGKVLRDVRVFKTDDVLSDPTSIFGKRLTLPIGIRGMMAAPLMTSKHLVGILYVGDHVPRRFTGEEETFFSILANHSATAIRNWELLNSTNRRAQLLELFHQISVVVQQSENLEVIENIVLTGITASYGLRFNRAMLLLLNDEKDCLDGITGIGQTNQEEAYRVWESVDNKSNSLEKYAQYLFASGAPEHTPLHSIGAQLHLSLQTQSESVFRSVIESGNPLIVDPEKNAASIDPSFLELFNPGEFVIVPLQTSGKLLGVIVADNKWNHVPIDDVEVELLVTCANQAAVAIERGRLHGELYKRVNVLQHLQEVAHHILDLGDQRKVLKRIADASNDVLKADLSYIVAYDAETGELLVDFAGIAGEQRNFEHRSKFSSRGLTARVLEDPDGMILIHDLEHEEDLFSQFAEEEGVRSVAVVRLEFQKEIVGVLYVNYRHVHVLDSLELNTIKMFADQAAIAIHNARLMETVGELATQKERNRLREDVHDAMNSCAFTVMMPAEEIRDQALKVGEQNLADDAELLLRHARRLFQQLDRILEDMRDPVLVEQGLVAALKILLNRRNMPDIIQHINVTNRPTPEVELVLYRICQEALSNIVKHAGISKEESGKAEIWLVIDAQETHLSIQDYGAGFDPVILNTSDLGLGIRAMKNWANKINANFDIRSAPDQGTRIDVSIA